MNFNRKIKNEKKELCMLRVELLMAKLMKETGLTLDELNDRYNKYVSRNSEFVYDKPILSKCINTTMLCTWISDICNEKGLSNDIGVELMSALMFKNDLDVENIIRK